MKDLKFILFALFYVACLRCFGQSKFVIPTDKYVLCIKDFISDCRKTTTNLPYKIHTTDWLVDVKAQPLFFAVSFILDGDTSLFYYKTKPIYKYYMDADSLVQIMGSYRVAFDFEAVGCFDYKDYMVVVYSFPLADPNYYKCYTINTYTKDGKRIDRLPFFMWRTDFDATEWGDEFDPSWLEMTGYIDDDFEITIRQKLSWSVIHEHDGEDFSKEWLTKQDEMRAHEEYHVYHINNNGSFIEINKKPKYKVDDNNNWTEQ